MFVFGLVLSWVVGGLLVAPHQVVVGGLPSDLIGEEFVLTSDTGSTLAGWHLPSPQKDGVIVLFHPFRGSRLDMLSRARLFRRFGYSVVMIDFQSHGESEGRQITLGHLEHRDVKIAIEQTRRMHPNEPIGVVGVSLGGASTLLASPLAINALVLESVYPTITDAIHNRVAARLGPLSTIPATTLTWQLRPRLGVTADALRPIDHLRDVGCPVLIASGTADLHTTADESRAMFAAASEPKELWLVDGAEHVDLYRFAPEKYEQKLIAFFLNVSHFRRCGSLCR